MDTDTAKTGCLSDEEIAQVVLAGPEELKKHSEDSKAHMHLVHGGCLACALKLYFAITFGPSSIRGL